MTGADQASVTNNNRKTGDGKSGYGKNSNYRYGCTLQAERSITSANGEIYSLDRLLLMGDTFGYVGCVEISLVHNRVRVSGGSLMIKIEILRGKEHVEFLLQ